MKLNSHIIFDNLRELFPVELYCTTNSELNLLRPQFYQGDENRFISNHLYIVKADHLPQHSKIEKDAVIICIGESIYLNYYKEKCCVIKISSNEDFYTVFNFVQDIYNKYDNWSEKLIEILNSSANIKEMIDCSYTIFNNPIFVIDANFHFVAQAGYDNYISENSDSNDWYPYYNDNLKLFVLGQFLELHELSMHIREPQLINLPGSSTLDINLFQNEEYIGCLTIDYRNEAHKKSDIALGKRLSEMINLALQKHSSVLCNEKSLLRRILQDIINCLPPDTNQLRVLDAANLSKDYVCIKMQFNNHFTQLPIGYVCNLIENNIPKSIAFEYDSAIVGFVAKDSIQENNGLYKQKLETIFKDYIESMDMRIGISNPFEDLNNARLYYLQACSALDNGSLIHSKERYYTFQDYSLMELIINSLGELTIDMYFSEGMKRLAEHDKSSSVSYLETLQTYLENNMSITKTSSILYIHRSTLLDRLTRIERDLKTSLKNPDERLKILIILKAIQIHKEIRGTAE